MSELPPEAPSGQLPDMPYNPLADAFAWVHAETEMPEDELSRLLEELRENLIQLDRLNPEIHPQKVVETVKAIKGIHAKFNDHITFEMLIDAALSHGEKDAEISRLSRNLFEWRQYAMEKDQELQAVKARGGLNWKHLAAGGVGGYTLYNAYTVGIDAVMNGIYTGDPYADTLRGLMYGVTGAGLLKVFKDARDNKNPPSVDRQVSDQYFDYAQAGLVTGFIMAFVDNAL